MKLLPRKNKQDISVIAGIIPGLFVYIIEEYLKSGIEDKKIVIPDAGSLEEKQILKNNVSLRYLRNYGAARGMLKDNPKLVSDISVALTILVALLWINEIDKKGRASVVNMVGLSALLGGAVSNTKDRLSRGFVVDYFSFKKGPRWLRDLVFNISDMAIFLGALEVALVSDMLPDLITIIEKESKKFVDRNK